jgi:hypothetical protein
MDFAADFPFVDPDFIDRLFASLMNDLRTERKLAASICTNLYVDPLIGNHFMRICLDRNLFALGLHADVLYKLLVHFIDAASESDPEKLTLFLPFIAPLIESLTGAIRASAVASLAILLLNTECCEYALKLPQFTLSSILKTAIPRAPQKCVPNLFVIANAIITVQEEASYHFTEEPFLRLLPVFFDLLDSAGSHPLFVFADSLIDQYLPVLSVSGVLDKILAIAQVGAFRQRKMASFLLVHLIHAALDLAEYPTWMQPALQLLFRTTESLSHKKCLLALQLVDELLDRDLAYFLPRVRSREFEMTLSDFDENGPDDIAELSRHLLRRLGSDDMCDT